MSAVFIFLRVVLGFEYFFPKNLQWSDINLAQFRIYYQLFPKTNCKRIFFCCISKAFFFFLDIRLRERALILANMNSMEMTAIREYVSIIKIKSIPLVVVLSYQIQYDWNVQYITALLYLLKVWRTKYLLNITENLPLLGKFWYYQNYTCEYSLVNNV